MTMSIEQAAINLAVASRRSGFSTDRRRQHEEKERKCFRAFPSGVGWLDGTRVVAGGPWRGGCRAVGLGRFSPSANMGGGEMSGAVCLRLLIGRQCFDVQRDSARAQAAGPIVGEIVKSHLV